MTAQDHFKAALRTTVGPALRVEGFKGSGATWRLSAANGDIAVVNVQSSQFSSAAQLTCVVNLSIVPVPWWEWRRTTLRSAKSAEPKEQDGLWRDRLHPTGAPEGVDAWWQVKDEQSADEVALDIVRRLQDVGVPTLRRLLNRNELFVSVRRGELGFLRGEANRMSFDRALAVLLADEGPSAELDALLTSLELDPGDGRGEATRRLTDWARARAGAHE